MKTIFLDTFQIHDNVLDIGYFVTPPIIGLDYPEVRINKYNKTGEHGALISSNLYGGRRIQLEGMVYSNSIIQFEQRKRALQEASRIVRNENAEPVPILLKFTTMDDLALQLEVQVAKFQLRQQNLMNANFMLDLASADFALLSQALNVSSVTRASGGGAVYPVIYPVVYGASTGGSVIIVNAGNAETYPIIILNGPVTNPIIQNTTVDRYMELSLSLAAGEQIIIDMRNKTIMKNGTQSVIAQKTSPSQFFWLEKGSNTIKFFTSSAADTGDAQIQWRNAYLGI